MLAPVAEWLTDARVAVLSGAGISTASGIPDYRDSNGVRRGRAPMMFQEFVSAISARKRYWARSMRGWPTVAAAKPNAAHRSLADLQAHGKLAGVITQNVDGLHSAAGSPDVVDLHGNLHRVRCLDCAGTFSRADIQTRLEAQNPDLRDIEVVLAPDGDAQVAAEFLEGFVLPLCPRCSGERLKPDVVFFGENVAANDATAAMARVQAADALLVVGSSLMAFSAFRLCQAAHRAGKPIFAINHGKTRADELIALKIDIPCERALPLLCNLVT